tara:strand:- start:119 stop:484 length:366 start_codon:yes stop_codon:yes gene_type:complete
MSVIQGKVAFVNLVEHEVYEGKTTGKYSIVLTLDQDEAEKMLAQGVRLRSYEDTQQRKFTTQYDVPIYDVDNNKFIGQITRGSIVKVQYSTKEPSPIHGLVPYLDKIRVLELAEGTTDEDF